MAKRRNTVSMAIILLALASTTACGRPGAVAPAAPRAAASDNDRRFELGGIVLETERATVTPIADGYRVAGDVDVIGAGGQRVTLASAHLVVERDTQRISGGCTLRVPAIGFEAKATVGVARGELLSSNLDPQRAYLYFLTSTSPSPAFDRALAVGATAVESTTVVLDPSDLSLYQLRGAVDVAIGWTKSGLTITAPLRDAATRVAADVAGSSLSGHVEGGTRWLPSVLPVSFDARRVEVEVAVDATRGPRLRAEANARISGATLTAWTGVALDDVRVSSARLDIDERGALLRGRTTASFSPRITLAGTAQVEAFFNGTPDGWSVTLRGRISVDGVALAQGAIVRLDRQGIHIQRAR
ncbi:MAG: hypothetical protein KC503_38315 [Myxococcales bacterium]|nr:hypothetical protein [Myxococcales bacterium]